MSKVYSLVVRGLGGSSVGLTIYRKSMECNLLARQLGGQERE